MHRTIFNQKIANVALHYISSSMVAFLPAHYRFIINKFVLNRKTRHNVSCNSCHHEITIDICSNQRNPHTHPSTSKKKLFVLHEFIVHFTAWYIVLRCVGTRYTYQWKLLLGSFLLDCDWRQKKLNKYNAMHLKGCITLHYIYMQARH